MAIDLKKIDYKKLGFFRFRRVDGKYLITNEVGDFLFLEDKEFSDLIEGKLAALGEKKDELEFKNFIKSSASPDINRAVKMYRSKRDYLFSGPSLHIFVVTLRCNHQCVYCHASAHQMEKEGVDMTQKTAKAALKIAFETTSPYVAIEFQGGEPLANWPVVKFIIQEARKKEKETGKKTELRMVSNFSLLTEEKYKYLLKNRVSLCTSLDGPRELHNKNRILIEGKKAGDSYGHVSKWLTRFLKDYKKIEKKGYIWRAAGIITISRYSLGRHKEIVEEYLKQGFDNIFLRPLDPFGFSKPIWKKIGYTGDDFIAFYKKALDYIIEINLRGKKFEERFAKIFLHKILTEHDLNMMDFRSPCGAGVGQIAYNYNGDVYTCDEGRMLSMMGDESFKMGNVDKNTYQELMNSPAVKTTCLASCLTGSPGCTDCAYQPYCGSCPIYNYFEQGNIFGQMPTNEKCKINNAILDYLFFKMQDKKVRNIFDGWVNK